MASCLVYRCPDCHRECSPTQYRCPDGRLPTEFLTIHEQCGQCRQLSPAQLDEDFVNAAAARLRQRFGIEPPAAHHLSRPKLPQKRPPTQPRIPTRVSCVGRGPAHFGPGYFDHAHFDPAHFDPDHFDPSHFGSPLTQAINPYQADRLEEWYRSEHRLDRERLAREYIPSGFGGERGRDPYRERRGQDRREYNRKMDKKKMDLPKYDGWNSGWKESEWQSGGNDPRDPYREYGQEEDGSESEWQSESESEWQSGGQDRREYNRPKYDGKDRSAADAVSTSVKCSTPMPSTSVNFGTPMARGSYSTTDPESGRKVADAVSTAVGVAVGGAVALSGAYVGWTVAEGIRDKNEKRR